MAASLTVKNTLFYSSLHYQKAAFLCQANGSDVRKKDNISPSLSSAKMDFLTTQSIP